MRNLRTGLGLIPFEGIELLLSRVDDVNRRMAMNQHDMQLWYEYNRWANARILGAAAKLTEEQYLAPGTFPHGGVRGTLVHALFAEWVWRLRWQGTAPDYRYRLQPEDFPTFASLHARWAEEESLLGEFVAALTDKKLEAEFDYTSTDGGRHRRLLWETMAHNGQSRDPASFRGRGDAHRDGPLPRRHRSDRVPQRRSALGAH
jgi:uncharacterized damage-inducible protein DinB